MPGYANRVLFVLIRWKFLKLFDFLQNDSMVYQWYAFVVFQNITKNTLNGCKKWFKKSIWCYNIDLGYFFWPTVCEFSYFFHTISTCVAIKLMAPYLWSQHQLFLHINPILNNSLTLAIYSFAIISQKMNKTMQYLRF